MEGCGGDDLGGRHSSHALQGLVLSCLILGEDSGGEGLSSGEAGRAVVREAVPLSVARALDWAGPREQAYVLAKLLLCFATLSKSHGFSDEFLHLSKGRNTCPAYLTST